MGTQTYFFRGTCKWAMVYTMDEKYETYKINLYMDEGSLALYKKSGIQNEIRTDEDGDYVVFRRPDTKTIRKELVKFGKPRVTDTDKRDMTDLIGNGSEVIIEVIAFDTMNGIGHRLEHVIVTNLVRYEGKASEVHMPEDWGSEVPF